MDWIQSLDRDEFKFLLHDRAVGRVYVFNQDDEIQQYLRFVQQPWLLCVLEGAVEFRDAHGTWAIRQGQLSGHVGDLRDVEFGTSPPPQLRLLSKPTTLVSYEGNTSFGALIGDPEKVRTLSLRLREAGGVVRDPLVRFLTRKQPYLFGKVSRWPPTFTIALETVERGHHIFRKDEYPRGLFVVFRGWVRLTDDHPDRACDHEHVFAILEEGDVFGELERPLDGLILPTSLSAIAGRRTGATDKDLFSEERSEVWILRIPYEELDELARADARFEARVEDFFRSKLVAWWPVVMGAFKASTVDAPIACVLLREALAESLRHLDRSWPPQSEVQVGASMSLLDGTRGAQFIIDFRHLVVEGRHRPRGESLGTSAKRVVAGLEQLQVARIIEWSLAEGDDLDQDREDLKKQTAFAAPQPIVVRILDAHALLEVAYGTKIKSVGGIHT